LPYFLRTFSFCIFSSYDLVQLRKLAQSTITPLCITLALHTWKGFMPPLILQSIIPVAGIMGSQLAKIHLLGANAAKGDLKRPWKASSPFAAFKDLGKEVRYTAARSACMPSGKEATTTSRTTTHGSMHWDCGSLLHSRALFAAAATLRSDCLPHCYR